MTIYGPPLENGITNIISILYNNDYQNAIAIYKSHAKDTISPGLSWEDSMRNDLTCFKEHNFDVKIFDRVFAELKIRKPEGY